MSMKSRESPRRFEDQRKKRERKVCERKRSDYTVAVPKGSLAAVDKNVYDH